MNEQQSFNRLTNEFTQPIIKWQHAKPAKRNAFLLFRDEEAGEWHVFLLGNKRAKYPTATALKGLGEAMIQGVDLLGWIKANVNYAERELKKRGSHGKD